MKKYGLYIFLLVLAFGLLIYSQYNLPKELDWRTTFSQYDKIPNGSYVLHEMLKDIHGEDQIKQIDSPLYTFLDTFPINSTKHYNILIITTYLSFQKAETKKLLEFIKEGNSVFIAAYNFSQATNDTLKLEHKDFNVNILAKQKDSIFLSFTNPALLKDSFRFPLKIAMLNVLKLPDSAAITVLGYDENKNPNFIDYQIGKGHLFLHTAPEVFTNYSLLELNNWKYAFTALSYLPNQITFWDELDKPFPGGIQGINKINSMSNKSILNVILSKPPLRWAYFLTLITILLYILFEGKRKQRVIPVIQPLRNTTLDFVETVGRLYFENGNNKKIAEKKIAHFHDFIKHKLNLRFSKEDNVLLAQISAKTSMEYTEIEKLFIYIEKIKNQVSVSDSELFELNEMIDNIYKKTKK